MISRDNKLAITPNKFDRAVFWNEITTVVITANTICKQKHATNGYNVITTSSL